MKILNSSLTAAATAVVLSAGVVNDAPAVLLLTSSGHHADAFVDIAPFPGTTVATDGVDDPLFANATAIYDIVAGTYAGAAGRAGAGEIAANAEFEITAFPPGGGPLDTFEEIRGLAQSTVRIDAVTATNDVQMEFFLPPAFLELDYNLEIGSSQPLAAEIQADIVICRNVSCDTTIGDTLFQFFAVLEGNSPASAVLINNAFGPTLAEDPAPLEHTSVVSSIEPGPFGIPLRRLAWDSPAFMGTLDLGDFGAGEFFEIEYTMLANVSGVGALNRAAAAINDPFTVSGDPVQAGSFVIQGAVASTPAPEPSSTALLALGLLGAGYARRRRAH